MYVINPYVCVFYVLFSSFLQIQAVPVFILFFARSDFFFFFDVVVVVERSLAFVVVVAACTLFLFYFFCSTTAAGQTEQYATYKRKLNDDARGTGGPTLHCARCNKDNQPTRDYPANETQKKRSQDNIFKIASATWLLLSIAVITASVAISTMKWPNARYTQADKNKTTLE